MALDFPNSPAVNDTYSIGNQTWEWTGSTWDLVATSGPQGAQGAQGPQGAQGAQGPQGATGPQGTTGAGVATGGAANTVLYKTSTTDYATAWSSVTKSMLSTTSGELGAAWTDYSGSVSFTNFTLGNGTVNYCKYAYLNAKTILYQVKVTLGSTSSVTGSPIGVSLPINLIVSTPVSFFTCYLFDSGVGPTFGYINFSATSRADLGVLTASGTYVTGVGTSSTVPFTWATSDFFSFSIAYEIA